MRRKTNKRVKMLFLVITIMAIFAMVGCNENKENVVVNVGSLKGPTSMGLVSLMEKKEAQKAENSYQFQMETTADALLTGMMKGELDIALVPANVASILYQKTEGQVVVIDINRTLLFPGSVFL